MPGDTEDVFSGACPSCYYAGQGHICRSKPHVQPGMASAPLAIRSSDPPLDDDLERHQIKATQEVSIAPEIPSAQEVSDAQEVSAAQEVLPSPNRVREDSAKRVSADGQDSQDPMHSAQDLAIKVGLRARRLLPGEQQATLERVESLLAIDGLEPDELDMARCILQLPIEEKIQAVQTMLQILRPMLSRRPFR